MKMPGKDMGSSRILPGREAAEERRRVVVGKALVAMESLVAGSEYDY